MVAPPDHDVLRADALHYAISGTPLLAGVSLGVREGEILAVTGPRGSGKTTLLQCLSGRLVPDSGQVWFRSSPVHPLGAAARERLRRESFGWIGTEPQLVPELTAWENAALPLLLRGTAPRAARTAAVGWLERLDVGDCSRSRPASLTQAQRQRVAVARALTAQPSVLFADDPTARLHSADRALVLRILTTAARSHEITVVLATHDTEAASHADRRFALLDGRPADAPAAEATGGPAGGTDDTEGRTTCSLSV
ncbi:ATP-binding cassette domain-containing protein [Streptomyces sp. F63]|uniref:ABC transporter ATP-binding protein n=1 Tax=Streptomyces sp. F63 TaxID=2824887 RepID=UPI001B38E7EE|nr:ATP-binding cassette domain-containing protein [Streptomyces sp. F63]MBQ0984423.1 ATP-binding cassette domain-containing protein [Streptomyces sp. F63]